MCRHQFEFPSHWIPPFDSFAYRYRGESIIGLRVDHTFKPTVMHNKDSLSACCCTLPFVLITMGNWTSSVAAFRGTRSNLHYSLLRLSHYFPLHVLINSLCEIARLCTRREMTTKIGALNLTETREHRSMPRILRVDSHRAVFRRYRFASHLNTPFSAW